MDMKEHLHSTGACSIEESVSSVAGTHVRDRSPVPSQASLGLAMASCMLILGGLAAIAGNVKISMNTISFLLAMLAGVSATGTA